MNGSSNLRSSYVSFKLQLRLKAAGYTKAGHKVRVGSKTGVSNSIYLGATTGRVLVRLGRIMYSTKRLCLKKKPGTIHMAWCSGVGWLTVHETWPRCRYYLLTMKC